MRILVTGGAGYVGSVSVEDLVEAGNEVVVLDNLSTGHRTADLAGAELVEGTYADRAFVANLLRERRIDAVLHCGARSLVGESIRDPAPYFRENLGGGVALLEAMRDAGVARLVISSTAAVYGVPATTPIDEDAPLRPDQPVWRVEARPRGCRRLVRAGLRAARRIAPLLQRGRRHGAQRRGP